MYALNEKEAEKLEEFMSNDMKPKQSYYAMYKNSASLIASYIIKTKIEGTAFDDLVNGYKNSDIYNPSLPRTFITFLLVNKIKHEVIDINWHHDLNTDSVT